ncbi:MAG: hypothetical protein M1576_01675 [Deltaproteobacteria bacterium]|jgi:hypothetical protein|nr:hypothetical protein [Deltaproteobacteria bacterium]
MDSEELKNLNNDLNFNKLDDNFNNANSQIERIMKKISNNAILIKNKYLGMIKNKINKSPKGEAVMDMSCGCGDSSFSVIVTEKDIEKIYAKFDKKCSFCNDFIKIKFIVKEN